MEDLEGVDRENWQGFLPVNFTGFCLHGLEAVGVADLDAAVLVQALAFHKFNLLRMVYVVEFIPAIVFFDRIFQHP